MFGLVFEERANVVISDPNRVDIACFVGFVARRPGAEVPRDILQWLEEHGWGDRNKVDQSAEAIADVALAETVSLTGPQAVLQIRIDGEAQTISLPAGPMPRTSFVLALSQRVRGGYVRLTGAETPGESSRLVIGSDGRGPAASITVEAHPALGYPKAVTAHGSAVSASLDELLDVPVPIDSWEVFHRLFRWEERPIAGSEGAGSTYLGAAVRSFFAQGGRKCYVVRVGDPWAMMESRAARMAQVARLLPGYPHDVSASPADQLSWKGVGHLFGLPDVSFLCLPDLPEAMSADMLPIGPPVLPPPPPEQFVECSEELPTVPDRTLRGVPAPRCDETGYVDWSLAISLIGRVLARWCREIQLVAAVPLPQSGTPAEADLLAFLTDDGRGYLASPLHQHLNGLASSFVQLTYPWLRTQAAQRLPEQLENPEGVLVGMLAQTALTRGAYRSAAGLSPLEVSDIYPVLRRDQMLQPHRDSRAERSSSHNLLQRVSLFGMVPGGLSLLSDVTTSLQESYRPASVNRLVSVIVRAARRLGEDIVFEVSGEALWAKIRNSLNSLLLGLLRDGALVGVSPQEAFLVRCDRSTMSQNDLDNGRVISRVEFTAAASIERITVVLALEEGGQVSLLTTSGTTQEAA